MDTKHEINEALLEDDSRWVLVQRIIASEGFERASQLRAILLYATKLAILQPHETLSEYDVACNILGRRPDFDPANDNIVRAQFSNLRHKLQHYFDTEGKNEPFVLAIPKGSYIPVFTPHRDPDPLPKTPEPVLEAPAGVPVQPVNSSPVHTKQAPPWWTNWRIGAAAVLIVAFVVLAFLFLRVHSSERPKAEAASAENPFIQFLSRSEGDVSIVVPDTSLVMIQDIVGANVALSDYISKDFPQRQIAMTKDPELQKTILSLAQYRTTSVNEALIAVDFLETLKRAGVRATIRYSHDLHVHDMNEGNSILIGGPNSDPWVSLFNDRINFRHVDNEAEQRGYFENLHPEPGEELRYLNIYSNQSVGYVAIVLTQNLSQSGYVLLINGADMQANEAAARFLLHGKLPPEILSVLNRKDIHYFELFLRSNHIAGEADSSFELVAYRIK